MSNKVAIYKRDKYSKIKKLNWEIHFELRDDWISIFGEDHLQAKHFFPFVIKHQNKVYLPSFLLIENFLSSRRQTIRRFIKDH